MNSHEHLAVYRWYDVVCRSRADVDAAQAIEERLKNETEMSTIYTLKYLLAGEYKNQRRFVESEEIYRHLFGENPHDPLPLITLDEQKLYYEEDLETALRIVDEAIEGAVNSGTFRRLALGVKARISLALKSYGMVEYAMRNIMDLEFGPGNLDCGIERDFFDRLPPRSIDSELAYRYERFLEEQS